MNRDSSTPSEERVEHLIASLAGVVSARVIIDDSGRIIEIHVLSMPQLHPKQIVRNVESALSAGLGVLIDRRVVSVAQLRPDSVQIPSSSPAVPRLSQPAPPRSSRLVLVGFDTVATAPLDASCSVTVRSDQHEINATGTGANTPQGRAEAAARAVLAALDTIGEDVRRIGLHGAAIIENNGKPYVLIAAHSIEGRSATLLTGVASLTRSPEEAGILACLHATNRWLENPL